MATRPLPGFSNWFYDYQKHQDRSLPCIWWPVLMSERRAPSLLQRHFRFTVGLGFWRWSWVLVHQRPEPETDFNDVSLGLAGWVKWSIQWSKGRLASSDLYALLKQRDQPWGRLVRFGAVNYHYGRLVLAREALAQSRSRQKSSVPGSSPHGNSSGEGLEMPDLSLPDVKSAPNSRLGE